MEEKDYSKYFNGPSLNQAKKRGKMDVHFIKDAFNIPYEIAALGKNRKYYIQTYGCQANERDTETLAGILEIMQYTATSVFEEADIIIFNTCAIRENAELKFFGKLGSAKKMKRTNPELIVGVCGCMAQEEAVVSKILASYPYVDLVFGTHNIHRLPILLKDAIFSKEMVIEVWSKEGDVIENIPSTRANKYKAWVNIMYGCDKFCTYCIVPYTRGKERSRLKEDIINEVQELIEDGYQEVTLLGQNVNSYGKDLKNGESFASLLEAVAKTSIPRIRFMTSHPWDFSDTMIDIIAKYENIMPFIHLPVQSGNNEILKLMGRRYTIQEYKKLFDTIKAKLPNCAISTDIIVGFPNEDSDQFLETLDIVEYCQYDNAYTFIYSPRIGTPAAKMEDNVPLEEKQLRLYKLNQKVNMYALQKNQAYIGNVVNVLVEGASKRNHNILTGYTESQKLVNFEGDFSTIGTIVKVKITEAGTWALKGEMIYE